MAKGNGSGPGDRGATGFGTIISITELKGEITRLAVWKSEKPEEEFELELLRVAKQTGMGLRKLRRWVDNRLDRDVKLPGGRALAMTVEEANRRVDGLKENLIVETANLPAAADAVRDLFAAAKGYFECGTPAKIVKSSVDGELPQIELLTIHHVVDEVRKHRRVVELTPGGKKTPATLRDRVARIYIIAKKGEWNLPRLAGITTTPLLRDDGSVVTAEGYDPETRMYCADVPALEVPKQPTESEARVALQTLRAAFQTFPFADSERVWDATQKLWLVDLAKPPSLDESSFLTGLMTSICWPCLDLAPGLMLVAAQTSGSGSGKGLLARAICLIAYGLRVAGFTPTKDKGELEKRINSGLLEGGPALFIDNVNGAVLTSPTLEGAMTERPFKVRAYCVLKNVLLDGAPFIVVTGNGLKPSQDLIRRFTMFVRLDAKMENPALRRFPLPDKLFLADIERRRIELLSAALTIWRFGRQNAERLKQGVPRGSYSTWERWSRDPLLELGCRDPVARREELAASDPRRQDELAILTTWWERHCDSR